MSSADEQYEATNDQVTQGNDYTSRPGQKQAPIPVQSDNAAVEDPIDPETADSDEQLARDENEAIDKSNIIQSESTRGAKPSGGYREPGDEEGLPGPEDGTSQGGQ